MSGDRALLLLGRWKLRGLVRRQWRRLKTPKGAFLTLLGGGLFVLWIGNLLASFVLRDRSTWDHVDVRVGLGGAILLVMTVSGALTHRGLFLPKEEIERLFAAPVSRAALVRYRLRASLARNLLGSLFIAMLSVGRMPAPGFAFVGILLAVETLTVVRQLVAIGLGALEGSLAFWLGRLARLVRPAGLVVLVGVVLLLSGEVGSGLGERMLDLLFAPLAQGSSPLEHPLATAIAAPFRPWSAMIGATGWAEFLRWFGLCAAIFMALFELTARLPVDTRELSLETSADVAARIRRAGRSMGAAGTRPSRRAAGRQVPWLFGRGAGGAVAWRKSGAILRKARGTFYVSALVLLFVAFLSRSLADAAPPWVRSAVFAGIGTIYLCGGLRFDFRDELDRMEEIKAWPLAPRRLFLAMLLPEVCLVSALIVAGLLFQGELRGSDGAKTLALTLALPLVVLAWVALDNAVFLFAPVRSVPGQEGVLQNAGRGVVVFFLRALAFGVVAVVGGGGYWLAALAVERLLDGSPRSSFAAGTLALLAALFGMNALLVWAGGLALRHFDVSRDT